MNVFVEPALSGLLPALPCPVLAFPETEEAPPCERAILVMRERQARGSQREWLAEYTAPLRLRANHLTVLLLCERPGWYAGDYNAIEPARLSVKCLVDDAGVAAALARKLHLLSG